MILPHSTESEVQVIGSLLIGDPNEQEAIFDVLTESDFYAKRHALIFSTCHDLFLRGDTIDLVSVVNALGQASTHASNVEYIANLTVKVISSANGSFHAGVVKDYADKRKLIASANELAKQANDPNLTAVEIIAGHDAELFKIASGKINAEYTDLAAVSHAGISCLEKAYHSGSGLTGVPCYFSDLDGMTAGFQKQDMIILAARPSMGKTAFALNLALNMAIHGIPVGFFSLEMPAVALWRRLVSLHQRIDGANILSGKVSEEEIRRILSSQMNTLPIFVDEQCGATIASIRSKARLMVRREGVQMMFVDYIGLINPGEKFANRNQEISFISARLKDMARELDIPVMVLCQMSRESTRLQIRPRLIDLRDSGSLEQDADIVMFIFRPDKAGVDAYEDGAPTEGVAELLIEKFRNGKTGQIKMLFEEQYGKFSGFENRYEDRF